DGETACEGKRSLRIRFQGVGNVDYHHVEQTAWVTPGVYRFRAEVETRDLTTYQRLRFHLFDAESPQRLDFTTEQLTGTHDWTRVEKTFLVPAGTNLVTVLVVRNASLKFDNITRSPAWRGSTRFRW